MELEFHVHSGRHIYYVALAGHCSPINFYASTTTVTLCQVDMVLSSINKNWVCNSTFGGGSKRSLKRVHKVRLPLCEHTVHAYHRWRMRVATASKDQCSHLMSSRKYRSSLHNACVTFLACSLQPERCMRTLVFNVLIFSLCVSILIAVWNKHVRNLLVFTVLYVLSFGVCRCTGCSEKYKATTSTITSRISIWNHAHTIAQTTTRGKLLYLCQLVRCKRHLDTVML